MEEDQQPTGFKIGLDKPEFEGEPKKPVDPPASKSGKKPPNSASLIVFLGLLVIGVAMVWVYYDIQDRLHTINASGTEEVAQLSREVNNAITDINHRLSSIEKSMQKAVADIKSNIGDTDNRIDKLQASIASFEKNLGSLNQDINPLKDQAQKIGQNLDKINETVQTLQKEQTQIHNRLKDHSAEIEKLSKTMVHREALDKALKKEREFYKQNMAHTTETLFSEISSFGDKLKTLRENIDRLEKKIFKIRQSSIDKKDSRATGEGPDAGETSSETMPVPENGEIIEQEIE